jgi:hypothetical protein
MLVIPEGPVVAGTDVGAESELVVCWSVGWGCVASDRLPSAGTNENRLGHVRNLFTILVEGAHQTGQDPLVFNHG